MLHNIDLHSLYSLYRPIPGHNISQTISHRFSRVMWPLSHGSWGRRTSAKLCSPCPLHLGLEGRKHAADHGKYHESVQLTSKIHRKKSSYHAKYKIWTHQIITDRHRRTLPVDAKRPQITLARLCIATRSFTWVLRC